MIFTSLMKTLAECLDNKQPIIIYFDNGLIFKSLTSTGVYESMNEFELEDPDFIEYYACAVEISEISQFPKDQSNSSNDQIERGKLLEISQFNEPLKIQSEDGQILWQKIDS